MERVIENTSFFRFLDELEALGMMETFDDLFLQLKDQMYAVQPSETICASADMENVKYHFYFLVLTDEDLNQDYVEMGENTLVLQYSHNHMLENG